MPISDWPAGERPREKLEKNGPQTLSDAELLAIFLRTGVKGKTAVDLARELLTEYGSLRDLLGADFQRFTSSNGLGKAKYAQLQAALELGKRHLRETIDRGDPFANPAETRHYLSAQMRDKPYEVFCCLFLDNRHRLISFDELFRGTINGASVHPREVVKQALTHNAAAVIFAHNHPSGIAEPSQADRKLTKWLMDALSLVEIRVLDHFIVGDGQLFSFSEHGLI
ncbi:MAG: DNA repair protein RadC [Gammaproteobacteria bacterium]